MRKVLLITAALAVWPLSAAPVQAQGGSGAWCSTDRAGAKNCGFSTHAQCMASASGNGASCDRNPLASSRRMKHRR